MEFGPFRLVRKIGVGGMGEVYLAIEEADGTARACVVKKVLPHLTAQTQFVHRFLDEARVATRLRHPNIARVRSMGEVDGEYYLSMEYVQGKTLSRFGARLREQGTPMPVGLALLTGELVCAGLSHAHAATDDHGQPLQLVHRDLSPANVCISYDGEVKIIDFGAAHSTLKEAQTAPRVVIGNLAYMAPEQARKRWVDGRADVYSLGAVLWELLTHQAFKQEGDPIERWRKAANPEWAAPSSLRPEIPVEVDRVILKALSVPVDGRWPDAAAFGMALGELRARVAPEASEEQLGALLRNTFKRESAAEISILERMLAEANRDVAPAVPVAPAPPRRRTPPGTRPIPRRDEPEGGPAPEEEEPETTGGQVTMRELPGRTATAPRPAPERAPRSVDDRAETVAEMPALSDEDTTGSGLTAELAEVTAPQDDRPGPPIATDAGPFPRPRRPSAVPATELIAPPSVDVSVAQRSRPERRQEVGTAQELKVLRELDADADETPSEALDEPPTADFDTLGRQRALLIGGTIFLSALALGLFLVLLLTR